MPHQPTHYPSHERPVNPEVYRLLEEALPFLGVASPLPAVYEDVLRVWRGLPVQNRRFRAVSAVQATIRRLPDGLSSLAALIGDHTAVWEIRLLAASLWALERPQREVITWPAGRPVSGDDPVWVPPAMACLTLPDPTHRYAFMLEALLADEGTNEIPAEAALPMPLLLIGFLKGLREGTLSAARFATCVLYGRVLHPGVAQSRSLRLLHPLLDYLGFSAQEEIGNAYRELVAQLWTHATADNWPLWYWVTCPGGPDLFPRTLAALNADEVTLPGLYELKYAPLPPEVLRDLLLSQVNPAITVLLAWMRGVAGEELALSWMTATQTAASSIAYTQPAWWATWRHVWLPAARTALSWLQQIPLPPGVAERHAWIAAHLAPAYRNICANLLLAQAAEGEGEEALRQMATEGDVPAIRALGLLPASGPSVIACLRHCMRKGGHPARDAATTALAHIARRQGLPDIEELERQHLLTTAWDAGPLGGERVRVGWQEGAYRLRLSLHAGKAQLEILNAQGIVTRAPADLRTTIGYREARNAQREVQGRYREFKAQLERYLLDGCPFTIGEFRYLLANPIFAHLAERLVWRTGSGETIFWTGPGRWETLEGSPVPLATDDGFAVLTLALVHPVTLAALGTLANWQMLAADRRLTQPFQQLFREVYTSAGEDGRRCERFAGRRIDPVRAYALLRTVGFTPGAGTARCDWPQGIIAHFCWAEDATGRDLYGPQRRGEVTTGALWFTQYGEEVSFSRIDPVIFSETLRTANLVATRAACGDADLSSRETLALRITLLRQMARSFRLTNIVTPEDGGYAVILGTRATYRLNLASGVVLLEPEGRQILVPRQHLRWSPIEDTDTTTEILTLALALAHDSEIDDLTFLAQIG